MRIYVVGGAVRDALKNRTFTEVDFSIVGASLDYMQSLEGFERMGENVYVWKHKVTGEEFAMARRDLKVADGHHGFKYEVEGVSIEEDLKRRDLSINAIACPLPEDWTLDNYLQWRLEQFAPEVASEATELDKLSSANSFYPWLASYIKDQDFRGKTVYCHFDVVNDLNFNFLNYAHAESFFDDPVRILRFGRFYSYWLDSAIAPVVQQKSWQLPTLGDYLSLVKAHSHYGRQELIKVLSRNPISPLLGLLRFSQALQDLGMVKPFGRLAQLIDLGQAQGASLQAWVESLEVSFGNKFVESEPAAALAKAQEPAAPPQKVLEHPLHSISLPLLCLIQKHSQLLTNFGLGSWVAASGFGSGFKQKQLAKLGTHVVYSADQPQRKQLAANNQPTQPPPPKISLDFDSADPNAAWGAEALAKVKISDAQVTQVEQDLPMSALTLTGKVATVVDEGIDDNAAWSAQVLAQVEQNLKQTRAPQTNSQANPPQAQPASALTSQAAPEVSQAEAWQAPASLKPELAQATQASQPPQTLSASSQNLSYQISARAFDQVEVFTPENFAALAQEYLDYLPTLAKLTPAATSVPQTLSPVPAMLEFFAEHGGYNREYLIGMIPCFSASDVIYSQMGKQAHASLKKLAAALSFVQVLHSALKLGQESSAERNQLVTQLLTKLLQETNLVSQLARDAVFNKSGHALLDALTASCALDQDWEKFSDLEGGVDLAGFADFAHFTDSVPTLDSNLFNLALSLLTPWGSLFFSLHSYQATRRLVLALMLHFKQHKDHFILEGRYQAKPEEFARMLAEFVTTKLRS